MSETTTLLVALFTVAVFTFYCSSTKSSIGALYVSLNIEELEACRK